MPELVLTLVGNDNPQQKGRESDDRQGIETGDLDVFQHLSPAPAPWPWGNAQQGQGAFTDEAEECRHALPGHPAAPADFLKKCAGWCCRRRDIDLFFDDLQQFLRLWRPAEQPYRPSFIT